MRLANLVRRLALAAGVSIAAEGIDNKAKAELLHNNPNAYTIFEDDFNDGDLDGWVNDNLDYR